MTSVPAPTPSLEGREPTPGSPASGGRARPAATLIERIMTYPGRPHATWWHRRPEVLDGAVVVVLEALSSLQIARTHLAWEAWLFQQLLLLPLLFRRRHPSAVFATVIAVYVAQWSVGEHLVADFGLLVALYTVAAERGWRRALPAAVILEVMVVATSFRNSPDHGGALGSLVFLTGLATAALFTGTTVHTRGEYLEALEDRARRLERERDQQARLAATAERARIAREMHDIVAHSLSVMIALADGAAAAGARDPEAAHQAMVESAATGRSALAEMRRLLGVLRDGSPAEFQPHPTLAGLDALLTTVRAAGIKADYRVRGRVPDLADTAEANIYRIIQESLTNVLKHARQPTSVTVAVDWMPGLVDIAVTDDGGPPVDGWAAAGPPVAGGHGLTGIKERVGLYRGTVDAGPAPGGGWAVRARLLFDDGQP